MMAGIEQTLDIYLGKNRIATISLRDDQIIWHYKEAWQLGGFAVSPHLPLHGEIPSLNVQRYLRNLLPEGSALEEIITYLHISRSNTFGLMRGLGLDISGSLIFLPAEKKLPLKGSFRQIIDDEIKERLDKRDDFSLLIWDGKPRLSVAGVQDKINVVLNQKGQLGFGEGSLCSTHILKFEKQKLANLALNEFYTMRLAKQCGLSVADVELKYFGEHATLLVKRFDRKLVSNYEVKRKQVIDGCQALNLSPEYKYERNFGSGRDVVHIRDGVSYAKLFDFANQCTNPALTKLKILDWALFNTLIFNYDAHGKNISFYINQEGIKLAPFYDLVNIKMFPQFAQEMAMALGDEFDANTVNGYQLADFADSCHLTRSLVVKRLKDLINKLLFALNHEKPLMKNKQEKDYLKKYQKMVKARCEHFLSQMKEVTSIEL